MTNTTQKFFKDPFDDGQWNSKHEYIGLPMEECEDAGTTYGAMTPSQIKKVRETTTGDTVDDDGVITTKKSNVVHNKYSPQPVNHSAGVGDAMAEKYAPKPKTPVYNNYGGRYGSGGGAYGAGGYDSYYGRGRTTPGYGHNRGWEDDDDTDLFAHQPAPSRYSPPPSPTKASSGRDGNGTKIKLIVDQILGDSLADAEEKEVQLIAEILSRDVGQLFDDGGLIWGSDAGAELRKMMKKWLTENVSILPE